MDRRLFIHAVAGPLLTATVGAKAQKAYRIGFLSLNTPDAARAVLDVLRQVLRERGWIEGQNIVIEVRFAEGNVDRLSTLVAELIRLKVDIIVTGSSVATERPRTPPKRSQSSWQPVPMLWERGS